MASARVSPLTWLRFLVQPQGVGGEDGDACILAENLKGNQDYVRRFYYEN